jgi:8-oxo-dGTP diphosphatase
VHDTGDGEPAPPDGLEELDAPDAPWTRVGAYATCLDDDGRILLARLADGVPGAGRWTLPGGGLEWGEHPEAGVRREVAEETGLSVGAVGPILGVHSRVHRRGPSRSGPSVHAIGIVYRVTVLDGPLRPEVGGSTDTCAWFALDAARGLPLVPLATFALDLLGA